MKCKWPLRTILIETESHWDKNTTRVACTTNNEEVGERVHPEGPIEAVTDKGYHSNDTLMALKQAQVRSYVSEPDRGRRRWQDKPEAQQAVYSNRRRIHGEHGKQLLRRRGEFLERSFAHAYATGGMRRVYLRGRENVYKRVLIHLGGFNLSLVMRQWSGKGTPRGWQGFSPMPCCWGCSSGSRFCCGLHSQAHRANVQTLPCRARHPCCSVRGTGTKLLPPRTARRRPRD